jgi:hypothetical protein
VRFDPPGTAVAGPVIAIARSALREIVVVAVALLFEPSGSVAVVVTEAVFDADAPPKLDGIAIVVVMICDAPGVMVPSAQGYAVVHAPVLPTNVSPAGVRSATLTPVASWGPLFVTVTV